jgi:hypothetical protein
VRARAADADVFHAGMRFEGNSPRVKHLCGGRNRGHAITFFTAWVQLKVEDVMPITFQAKHDVCRPLGPLGGEGAPAGAGEGAAGRVAIAFSRKVTALRAAWNDALSWPCRATLPRQAGEGTASGSASFGKVFPPFSITPSQLWAIKSGGQSGRWRGLCRLWPVIRKSRAN